MRSVFRIFLVICGGELTGLLHPADDMVRSNNDKKRTELVRQINIWQALIILLLLVLA